MTLSTKPRFAYNGLTIIMSNPSRFDSINLLSANGGQLVNNALRPEFNLFQCDIRTKEDKSEFLPNTKCILLLGESAMRDKFPDLRENTIGQVRGSLYNYKDIPAICSFFPQDAVDIRNYEKDHNPLNKETPQEDEHETDEDDGISEKSRHGRTKRKNYAFWLRKDIEHCKEILKGQIPKRPYEPEYIIYPSSEVVCRILDRYTDSVMFFDIETDENMKIICFSFSFDNSPQVFGVPCISPDYSWAYSDLHLIFKSLFFAIQRNTLVAHNGATFDFFHLANNYKIPINRVADTMYMHHRCFPEVEKSLGHCISLWAWYEQFHKDEGGGGYNNTSQARNMWLYNCKDVFTMKLIYYEMLDYAKRRPGLMNSFEQVNASIKPYLITTLTGMEYREDVLKEILKENDALMTEYLRIITLLVGDKTIAEMMKRFKSALPSSNPQCVKYFHEMLGYPVVGKGKLKKDGTRGASLAKKNLYKLRLEHLNPMIDFIIAYREVAKESSSLKFNPYKI